MDAEPPAFPVYAGHTFTNVIGQGSSRLHLGDNHYKIDMRVVAGTLNVPLSDKGLPDVHGTDMKRCKRRSRCFEISFTR